MNGGEAAMIFFVFGGGMWVLRPIAGALAKRIAGDVPARRQEAERERDELHEEVASLRLEVAELAERVDFTERLLAKQQESARLERPR